jgi:hypothetical protein
MSGRPKLRAFSKKVDAAGGEDMIFERVAGGETIRSIMSDFGVSRGMFYLWMKEGDDARKEKYDVARRLSADALVEQGLDILDGLEGEELSSADVGAASARANYRKWLAGVRNRDEYGDAQAAINVNLNVGQMHIDAMRNAEIPAAEYEVLPGESKAIESTSVEEDTR